MKKIIMFIGTTFIFTTLFTSCATRQSVCVDPVIKDCFICDIALKHNSTPEGIASFFEGVNMVAIYKDKYTAKQALSELKKVREKLNTKIKYLFIKEFSGDLLKQYPELFILSKNYVPYMNEFNSLEIMDEKSKSILISWVDKLIMDMELLSSLKD